MVATTEHRTSTGDRVTAVRGFTHADRPAPWAARPTPLIVRAVGVVIVATPILLWLGMEARHRWHQVKARFDLD